VALSAVPAGNHGDVRLVFVANETCVLLVCHWSYGLPVHLSEFSPDAPHDERVTHGDDDDGDDAKGLHEIHVFFLIFLGAYEILRRRVKVFVDGVF
jgi:hypothetical protein